MAILAIAVTAGFARVSEERRIVGDQQAQVDAFAVAESGLERYVAMRDSMPAAFDSVAIPLAVDDTAFVTLFQLRAPAGPVEGLYVIRSRGVSHGGRFSFNTPPAQRTVAQYASLEGRFHGRRCRVDQHRGPLEDRQHRHDQRIRCVRVAGCPCRRPGGTDVRQRL